MSSLLRSSKFLRYFSSLNRNVIVPKKTIESLPVHTLSFHHSYYRDYVTAAQPVPKGSKTLTKQIQRLDQDVRRSGRVSLKDLQDVFDEMTLSSHATSTQSLMVIRCCGSLVPEETPEVKLKLVQNIWDTLEKQGVPMDVSHYNTLLMVYLENDHKFSPTEFLSMLDKKGVEPNRVTFQRLIAAYCQQGNIEGATRILEFMKEKQMPISENIFNSLIIGHSQANDIESAKGIIGVMKQAGIEPSNETYTALLCCYAKIGDMNGITEVLKTAESNDIVLYDRMLLDVIYHLAINGHSKLIDMVTPRLSRQSGYNQDAKNTILRLIVKEQDDAAMKVFKTMTPPSVSDEETPSKGTFILKQLVKMNRPIETVLAICDHLQKTKDNERALFYATESCFINGKIEMGLKLVDSISRIEPVCQHYFWPALCSYGRNGDQDGIIRTLKQMSSNMNQPVPNETLRDYVVEYIGSNEKGIITMRQAGITVASGACAVVAHHLNNFDLASAAKTASRYRANYNLITVRRGIVQAYKVKPDLDSLILIMRSILSNLNNTESTEPEEGKEEPDTAGSVLLGIASALRQDRSNQISKILKGYLEYGMGISSATANSLQEILTGEELTPEISNLLTQLTSPDLSFVPLERSPMPSRTAKPLSYGKDESLILEEINIAEAKEQSTDALKFQLISLYCKQQEYAKADKIKQELADKGVTLPPEYLLELLDICVSNEDLLQSESYYKDVMSKSPKAAINDFTVIKLAGLYINAGKFDDAINILKAHSKDKFEEKEFSYTSTCWKLLNSVAETGDAAKVDALFNTLSIGNFIIPTNVLLGSLVKVHIVNGDIKKALDKFEECCTVYRATPWKNEIACKLIQSEDAASLQRLTDLSSQVHGEVNSLYDLVLSFIECGRIRQARKILETPGLRTRYSRLSSACLRYMNEGHVSHLENLVEVTKDLPHIDRADIYYHLLGSYCNGDEVDKALGLWTQMQEEDVQPTDRFLYKLANLLKKHQKPVPFSVPTSVTTDRFHSLQKETEQTAEVRAFRRAVYGKDLDKALQLKQNLSDVEMHASDRSALITLLINNGRLGESTKLLTQWLELGLRPNIKTLNYLINSVAKTGDTDTLGVIGNMLDEDLKRLTSFSNRYTHCMVESGKTDEVLKQLETELDNADTPEKIEKCRQTFPRGGIFSVLLISPDYISKYEKLVLKYKEKGILEPLNILWINYVLNNDKAKASEAWKEVKTLPRIMYQPILKKARSDRDLVLATELLDCCKETDIKPGALGAIHSCILDICIMLERVDDGLSWLDETLKTIPIDNIGYSTLKRIKLACERQGKLFKYTIPPKRRRSFMASSSSDSDSDDEIRQKA